MNTWTTLPGMLTCWLGSLTGNGNPVAYFSTTVLEICSKADIDYCTNTMCFRRKLLNYFSVSQDDKMNLPSADVCCSLCYAKLLIDWLQQTLLNVWYAYFAGIHLFAISCIWFGLFIKAELERWHHVLIHKRLTLYPSNMYSEGM